ncbi:unnamed protein product, partial [Polarella glacialis]
MAAATLRYGSLPGVVPLRCPALAEELLEAYLARLGVRRPSEPSLEVLTELLAAQLSRVCYENIDVKLGKPVPELRPEAAVRRVAVRSRGGYCFIVVEAFAALLCSLGFEVSLHPGVVAADPPPAEKWGDHVVLMVHLDGTRFVADCGLGEGPRKPFKLASSVWEEDGFTFALEEREGGTWRFHNPANLTGTMPGFSVDISTSVADVSEFEAFHRFYWTDETSGYVRGPVVALILAPEAGGGLLSMHGCVLRRSHPEIRSADDSQCYEVVATASCAEEWFALLRGTFFMPLDDLSEE